MLLSRKRLVLSCVTTAALAVTVAPMASAQAQSSDAAKRWHRTLTTDVLLPFQIAVGPNNVFVADGATKTISRLDGKTLTPLAHGYPGRNADVAGIDVGNQGSYAYTTSVADPVTMIHTKGKLVIKKPGQADVEANLAAYEGSKNPDGDVTYGLLNSPDPTDCAAGKAFLTAVTGGPPTYNGLKDSHPYGVVSLGQGDWAVADAGGNDIVKVDAAGKVSTIAVLPKQRTVISQAFLDAVGAPPAASCLVGKTYAFEPVPTDVEVGPYGLLYVSTLPGGPEDPSLGARGSVYVVNSANGTSSRLATGFAGATNVAVARNGVVYVAELFGGKITQVSTSGAKKTFVGLQTPLAVEVDDGYVYAATLGLGDTGPNGNGSITKYKR